MLTSKQTNSSSVKKNSTFQDKPKDIKNFSNWSAKEQMVAVSVVGAIVGALLPLVAVALPLAATFAIGALTLFFAYKTVEYTFKGLKWSAEKTVYGAKHIGGKIKDGAVYAKNSLKEAASSVRQVTREGNSSALKTMGNSAQKLGRKMSNSGASMSSLDCIPYSIDNEDQTVVLKTEEKTKNFNSVKEMLVNEILQDKTVNKSALTKKIFSELNGKILEKADSIDGPQGFKKDQLVYQLTQQAGFVNKLDAKKLQNLLAQDDKNLYEIFSEHHDEIKKIIRECTIEHKLSNSIENLNKVASKCGESKKVNNVKYQVLGATPTTTIGGRTGATRRNRTGNITKVLTPKIPDISASLTNLNEVVNSFSQSSLSEDFFNRPTVKRNFDALPSRTPTRSNSVSSLASNSSYSSATSKLCIDDSIGSKSSSFSNLSSSDSGFNSPSSSPQHVIFTGKDGKLKTQANLRNTGSLEKLVGPSSAVTVNIDVEQQALKINGK